MQYKTTLKKLKKMKTIKKSRAASKVLQLMDKDFSYSDALKLVLYHDKRLSKSRLEKELDNYI